MRRSWWIAPWIVLVACGNDESGTSFGEPSAGEGSSSSGTSGAVPTGGVVDPTSTGEAVTGSSEAPGTSSESSGDDDASTQPVDPGTSSTSTSSTSGETTVDATTSDDTTTTGPPPDSCDDAQQNQDETDIDCGGAVCEPCAQNGKCEVDGDCTSGWCEGGKCGDPGCLADADCDEFDLPCADSSCNIETKFCEIEPILEDQPCEDGDLCSTGELCSGGACVGGTALDCSGLTNVCGIGVCDAQVGGCVAQPLPDLEGMACDDGFVCTPDDTCNDGLCGAGGPGFLWFEDFSEPDPGWTIDAHWQIGAAKESMGGKNGKDPEADHTPSGDEMLAGTLIGDLLPADAFARTCLTSPAVDASGMPTVWLNFWRHLHTDYFPYAVHTVEAWNGSEWSVVDIGYINPGVNDAEWTQVSFDLSAYANDALQIRVCVEQFDGAKASAGWSLDDVTIGPYVCTPNG